MILNNEKRKEKEKTNASTSIDVLLLASAVEEYFCDEIGKSGGSPAKSSLTSKLPLGSFSIYFFLSLCVSFFTCACFLSDFIVLTSIFLVFKLA